MAVLSLPSFRVALIMHDENQSLTRERGTLRQFGTGPFQTKRLESHRSIECLSVACGGSVLVTGTIASSPSPFSFRANGPRPLADGTDHIEEEERNVFPSRGRRQVFSSASPSMERREEEEGIEFVPSSSGRRKGRRGEERL